MSSGFKKAEIFKIIGIVLILVGVGITISIRCLSKPQLFSVYLLSGVGIALLFSKSAEKTEVSYSMANYKFVLFGSVAFSAVLILINPIKWFDLDDCNTSPNISVSVINFDVRKSKQDIMLRSQGYIVMTTKNGESKKSQINENGQAIFQNLHLDDQVWLRVDFSEPYKSACPESTFLITNDEVIYLPVLLEGIDKVPGRVTYNESPLEGVRVSIGELEDTTDVEGRYKLIVPENQQSKLYEVWFNKKGYKSTFRTVHPQGKQNVNVEMEKL